MKIEPFILRDKQQDPPVARCPSCGGEQYREDTMYIWDGKLICSECMEGMKINE